MTANTLSRPAVTLGSFLRERRSRLKPEPGNARRRRTPGLRREEVATRAGVSVTWYTWLEQGRGGPPSAELLERLAHALELDPDNRELLFLLAQHRPPPLVPALSSAIPPTLQRVLDALPTSPAIVKTPTWDIVAWNRAAAAVLADYAALPVHERNVLRRLFGDPATRASLPDWEDVARFAIAVFRIDVARAGGCDAAAALTAELRQISADFDRLWADTDVRSHGAGVKRLKHPQAGLLNLEYSAYAVDGADGLTMIVFTPASPADARKVEAFLSRRERRHRAQSSRSEREASR
jgi:transcriptional regulator with XRE-family HTH domain